MSGTRSRKPQNTKPWWRYSRNRNKVWLALLSLPAAVGIAGFVWLASQGGHQSAGGEDPIPVGQQLQPFELPDVVSQRNVSLGDYLGKQEIVIVGYMGFF